MAASRVVINSLEVAGPGLAPAAIDFKMGLNVISGVENRGKSYVTSCFDFLFGADDPPDQNAYSRGYQAVSVTFTVAEARHAILRRWFDEKSSEHTAFVSVDAPIPMASWNKLAKRQAKSRQSLSEFWLSTFGFKSRKLRKNKVGDEVSFTVRHIAHLIIMDELRIMAKRTPTRSTQATSWTSDREAFTYVLAASVSNVAAIDPQKSNVIV